MYDVISPDGFSITVDELYKSEKEARTALNKFVGRFKSQGFYSGRDRRYTLEELPNHCEIVKV